MVDLRITLGWILIESTPRCEQFVLYGLGQTKLWVEHLKTRLTERGEDPDADRQVKAMQGWIDSQQFHFLTEVNVGNWAGTDLRSMAAGGFAPRTPLQTLSLAASTARSVRVGHSLTLAPS